MLKQLRNGIAVATLALAFVAAQAQPAQAQNEIVIGSLLAMSGNAKIYGEYMSRGMELAIDQINKEGGINGKMLRLEIGDHKGGQVKAATIEMQRMINLFDVQAVLSSFSPPTLAAQSIAKEEGILVINGGGWSPSLVGKEYLWNTRLTGGALAEAILQVAWEDGIRKIAMIYRNESSGIDTAASARAFWTGKGGTVVTEERFDIEATNFSSQLAKIRTARPDALVEFAFGKQHGIIIKQARDFGVKVPIYGIDFTPDDAAVAGDAIEGFKFAIDEFNADSDVPETQRFVKDFRAKFNTDPEFYGANYYEAMFMLRDVMLALDKEGKPIDGRNLDAKIREIRCFRSVYGGEMCLKDNGTVSKPIAIFQVKNGKRELVARIKP